ncbi:MAG TPA: asparagine synthase (glutamine-hydrolyzing), partial [Chthonomonadaceae bacterium]|nr:asparagine synthase (glutamine-hydrolyzing) [Chthonomonadaceae bacterium]
MCGIAGIISQNPVLEETLQRSAERMRHRGPDALGITTQGRASLVFRRLAIIDLSPDGNQPMTNETGTVWVVFNGEIYNFQALRQELEARHEFRSKTDTEVILHGYEEWGFEALLRRLDGMYAIALWDSERGELFLARDRLGKKPLYYAEQPESLAFASTLNALLELLPDAPDIDPLALDSYLVYQAVPAPQTIYRGVRALPPAHYAHWREGRPLEVARYWRLSYAQKRRRSEKELLAELDTLVRASVERRLVSDVPLGAFLSGGVDSSLIVAIMTDLGARPVEAVHVGFEEAEFDERPYARAVAGRWGAHLHEHVMRADEVQNLPQIVWHYGQPLADVSIVPTYAVARAAREHVTVILNGDGGDEAFAGYARPIVTRAAERARALLPPSLRGAAGGLIGRIGKPGQMLAGAIQQSAEAAFVYDRGLRSVRSALYTPGFLACLEGADPDAHYRQVWREADGPTDTDRALYGDLTTYLPDQLLVKMDVSTMAHSVEARSPLLDRQLVEYAATIPAAQLTAGYRTKPLLKRLAERYVPSHVLHRRKRGFVMPASRWLRAELAPHLRALLGAPAFVERGLFRPDVLCRMLDEHQSGQRDWGDPLWTLMVLEIWSRLFVDRTL